MERQHIGRALADRLHRRHPAADAARDPKRTVRAVVPTSRATRLRRFLGAARVTPYQLRRGWLW
ncbi:MAG TPA: hypothetical protein VJ850_02295 [Candidatus Limnocylindrales bacterium]|nr:hypothetical protein [Candidatus Limnocylindrales bacterium]